MKNLILIIQMVVGVSLIIMILLQNPQETGNNRLSLVQPKFNRRGLEKVTFYLTVILLALFLTSSLLQLLI
ncbi:MAG: preprotein translocase subunit SecG [Patescibacteria group bacterium]|nr:preprotein translocase subunit SecG [Patescibacteria group bacterium]